MPISKVRTILYRTAKYLGDVDAVRKGRILKRLKNRIVGKYTAKIFKK